MKIKSRFKTSIFLTTLSVLILVSSIQVFPASAVCESAINLGGISPVWYCVEPLPEVLCDPSARYGVCCDTAAECTAIDTANDINCANTTFFRMGIRTAIGCLVTSDPMAFINQLLIWSVGIGVGLAFLTIIYAGFLISTASGDAKRLTQGKDYLLSAVMGLALIATAVVILNFIGVRIFALNSLGFRI
jgi:hypothetical protein